MGWHFTLDNSNAVLQSLAQGQSITQVYTVTFTDDHGAQVSQDVTVTINGANDAPTIISSAADAAGAVTEDSATLSIGGTLEIQDLDLIDTHTAEAIFKSATSNAQLPGFDGSTPLGTFTIDGDVAEFNTDTDNGASLGWHFSLDNSNAVLQSLAQGQTITQVYTVTFTDNHGAQVSQDVTVTITGTNDAPTLADLHIGSLADTAAADTFSDLTGTLVGNDVDTGETATLSYAVLNADHHAVTTVAGLYGSLTVNPDGSYSYVPNATAINALSDGAYTDTFTVQTKDTHGATGTATLTVDVTGTNDENDAPVIDVNQISVSQEGDQVFVHGITVTDADAVDGETFTLSAIADSGTYVDPASASDTFGGIASALQGLTYTDPGQNAPATTDTVTVTVTDGHGASDTVNLIFNLSEQGPVDLASTTGKDVLFGSGYQDQFVFEANSNHDTILDFAHGQDHIDLTAVVATDIDAAWIAQHVAPSGTDTLITLSATDTILLKGVANVQPSDFIVHA
nr:VCBS domain-containing protein [Bradyrhizobium japonicum]